MDKIRRKPDTLAAACALLLATAAALLAPHAAEAKDPLFGEPWNFKVRNNPVALNRALVIQQMKNGRLSGTGSRGAAAGGGNGGGIMTPNVAANYSVITVLMGDGAVGDIDIGTQQDSVGDQSAESTSAVSLGGDATIEAQP